MGIQITISIDESSMIRGTPSKVVPKTTKKPKPAAAKSETTSAASDALELRLLARDDLDDSDKALLESEIIAHASSLLKKKNIKELKRFLRDNKHHFDPELREELVELINQHKKKI